MGIFNKMLGKSEGLDLSGIKVRDMRDVEIEKRVDLVKKTISLQKNPVPDKARVALVLDYSGSMRRLYNNGTVQSVIEKILPLAIQFDDDGELDVWLFENNFKRIKSINLNNFNNYIKNERILERYGMGGTEYAPVMRDVVKKYTKEEKSELPNYVLFITDGDNFDKPETDQIMKDASHEPIFWQFLGLGNSEFKYLEKLDTMSGRKIDNANFFSVNDINSLSDEKLYEKILFEYPTWCQEAKNTGVIG
ncbi:vWA domain-containing protein [Metaclostridioides mangenotii]|uniref:vWA domain-containing protein n=1 Tax=Metaclostridioides mangenotii TaxID=1540 RepID=UPI0004651D21|nr:VWA domain-containing protein [Clostridioides mangenotii]